MKIRCSSKSWVLPIALALTVAACSSDDEEEGGLVFAIGSEPFGQSYGEWGLAWWQWVLGQTKETDVLTDETGENCAAGQPAEDVWYLAGGFGGEIERECTVPCDRALFFPMMNFVSWYPGDGEDCDDVRSDANNATDEIGTLEASVDGEDIPNLFDFRAESSCGTVSWTHDVYDIGEPLTRGAVTDGYWLMLRPLAEGDHIVRFGGENPVDAFSLSVEYTLQVVCD